MQRQLTTPRVATVGRWPMGHNDNRAGDCQLHPLLIEIRPCTGIKATASSSHEASRPIAASWDSAGGASQVGEWLAHGSTPAQV